MKTFFSVLFFNLLLIPFSHSQTLKTVDDSLAYSLGFMIGENLQKEGYQDLPMNILFDALLAALADQASVIPAEECQTYVKTMSTKVKMKQYDLNRTAGEEFLAKNKTKPGVIALENGLQYEILRAGDGVKPNATDEVIVHYHGTLPDGTIFDSSVDRGESISFALNRVIKGWTEILQLMPVGSKWRVYIPYALAYGDRPAGPHIKPYSALIFEIELLGIK